MITAMAYVPINTHSNNTGLVTVVLIAEHKRFTFIIDTGSNISHIDTEAAKLLQNSQKIPTADSSVTGINGSLQSSGKIRQCFNSNIFTFDHEFFITDLTPLANAIEDSSGIRIQGILGTDFLSRFRCHLDFKKSRLHLG